MSVEAENSSSGFDMFKWVLVALFLIGAIYGNHYFAEYSLVIRVVAILILSVIALLIAATTEKGKEITGFAKEARVETRKVVWPTRQETIQTTLIIMLAVTVISLVLWGLDGILVRIVAFILGQEV